MRNIFVLLLMLFSVNMFANNTDDLQIDTLETTSIQYGVFGTMELNGKQVKQCKLDIDNKSNTACLSVYNVVDHDWNTVMTYNGNDFRIVKVSDTTDNSIALTELIVNGQRVVTIELIKTGNYYYTVRFNYAF